ncbi:MAG: patatin-like phospholipase family protein [Rhizobiaceae bacterium]
MRSISFLGAGLYSNAAKFFSYIFLCSFIVACSGSVPRNAVPGHLADAANIAGMPSSIRIWGDELPQNFDEIVFKKIAQMKQRSYGSGRPRITSSLAISGGSDKGAFGAGLLNGWSDHGSRPEFEIVTGVSTGALIAPFAYLGSAWDDELEQAYTSIKATNIFRPAPFPGTSIASNKPLANLIAGFLDEDMLAEIAARHSMGYRLLIGTTNLDAQRPVIWDIGEIASTGHPDALQLIRDILLASSAIPGAFPPTRIDVVVDGKSYTEYHVDGGVTQQVFMYPTQINPDRYYHRLGYKPTSRIYVIRNGKIEPEYLVTKNGLLKIAARSVGTLIKFQGTGDLRTIYSRLRNSKAEYRLAYISPEFDTSDGGQFDQDFMIRLYNFAYEQAKNGYPWDMRPPL